VAQVALPGEQVALTRATYMEVARQAAEKGTRPTCCASQMVLKVNCEKSDVISPSGSFSETTGFERKRREAVERYRKDSGPGAA
jgi:hypothetical protein